MTNLKIDSELNVLRNFHTMNGSSSSRVKKCSTRTDCSNLLSVRSHYKKPISMQNMQTIEILDKCFTKRTVLKEYPMNIPNELERNKSNEGSLKKHRPRSYSLKEPIAKHTRNYNKQKKSIRILPSYTNKATPPHLPSIS